MGAFLFCYSIVSALYKLRCVGEFGMVEIDSWYECR